VLFVRDHQGASGSLDPLRCPSFPTHPCGSSSRTVPRFFRNGFILPSSCSPAECCRSVPTSPLQYGKAPSGGFVPLRDINQKRPLDPGFPVPESVPSSAFRTPPTVCSASGLAGLFHPAAASRVHSSGVFPPAKPYRLVDGPCPLAVIARPLLDGCPPCSTDLRPASRAFLFTGIRCDIAGV
jgi:hypothetical protein